MEGLVSDTHALVWYLLKSEKLSAPALSKMEATIERGGVISVPSVCLVEIVYLGEKGRIPWTAWDLLQEHLDRPDTGLSVVPLDRRIAETLRRVPRKLVPDMPDRIIAATAVSLDVPLVTRDGLIKTADVETIW
ncbi:MAG: type II toxin-antitoxin system VapC family toxin [candidate division Zixibacteria bacterium]|nr:type II toxin-antitoxin system VapC family toxin [candidate division Zixibacteria bacterium]